MNISNKFINNCNNFEIDKIKNIANKLKLATNKPKHTLIH